MNLKTISIHTINTKLVDGKTMVTHMDIAQLYQKEEKTYNT